ncbi:hypothetical protein [Burkholderia stabilis]|uniref:hypothetical protein n=1 Tax=Burkholderia stabilis TaxID=95485 RepID=UPI001F4AC552|nr:hypothetical protein [Burkholderia stabilis]
MQDITGHFALPLARPFSELPPPFGRRRTPFVKSQRPRPSVFNLHGTREAPVSAAVRATDFGSDNKPWVKPRPARRRWQPTLLTLAAGLVLGSVGLAGAHALHGNRRAPSRNTVYQAAISTAPARTAKAPVVVPVDTDGTPGMATVAAIGELAAARDEAALTPDVQTAMPPVPKATSTARRKAVRLETARERLAGAAPASGTAGATASRAHAARPDDASATAPRSAHADVGMTAAEFRQWLAATREPVHATASTFAASPTPDLHVALPGHTRLTDTESASEQ